MMMTVSSLMQVIYHVFTKAGLRKNVNTIDLCFVRTLFLFLVSLIMCMYYRRTILGNSILLNRKSLLLRSFFSGVAQTVQVLGLVTIPLYFTSILLNT